MDVVIFEGGPPPSPIEKELLPIRRAVMQDNFARLLNLKSRLNRLVVVTNFEEIQEDAAGFPGVEVQTPQTPFHFGRELHRVVFQHRMERVIYLGNACFPLLQEEELEQIISSLDTSAGVVYTNNVQSSDLVAFTPGEALDAITLPSMDNSLAVNLRDEGGLAMHLFPSFPGILFDLDTPTDYLVLSCLSSAGPRTSRALENSSLNLTTMQEAVSVLDDYYLEAALIGRIGAPLIAHINHHLLLRLRIISEERGMKALGRLQSGEVISLLGFFLGELGLESFFSYLEKVVQVAFIDSRVLFAHFRKDYSAQERFLSDLGRWEQLEDPWLKDFTRLANECRIPVILGGHSLVSGGLWVLTDELASRQQ